MSNKDYAAQAERALEQGQPQTAQAWALLALASAIRNQGKPTPVPAPEGVLKGVQRPPWSQQ